jgi:hypothetical protein
MTLPMSKTMDELEQWMKYNAPESWLTGYDVAEMALKELISMRQQLDRLSIHIENHETAPIAAIMRYWRNSSYDVRRAKANGYATEMFDDDDALIEEWVNAMEYAQKSDAYSDAWTSADINE